MFLDDLYILFEFFPHPMTFLLILPDLFYRLTFMFCFKYYPSILFSANSTMTFISRWPLHFTWIHTFPFDLPVNLPDLFYWLTFMLSWILPFLLIFLLSLSWPFLTTFTLCMNSYPSLWFSCQFYHNLYFRMTFTLRLNSYLSLWFSC